MEAVMLLTPVRAFSTRTHRQCGVAHIIASAQRRETALRLRAKGLHAEVNALRQRERASERVKRELRLRLLGLQQEPYRLRRKLRELAAIAERLRRRVRQMSASLHVAKTSSARQREELHRRCGTPSEIQP